LLAVACDGAGSASRSLDGATLTVGRFLQGFGDAAKRSGLDEITKEFAQGWLSRVRTEINDLSIQHAIWLYLRFTLSYRDVEELLAERGLDVSYETVRRWVLKFGPLIARKLRQHRPRPSARWHLDEMVVRIDGKRMYLWRTPGRSPSLGL
jgi:hypothetical protein